MIIVQSATNLGANLAGSMVRNVGDAEIIGCMVRCAVWGSGVVIDGSLDGGVTWQQIVGTTLLADSILAINPAPAFLRVRTLAAVVSCNGWFYLSNRWYPAGISL